MKDSSWSGNRSMQFFIREAESLIEGKTSDAKK
jgi:hypothetical protein